MPDSEPHAHEPFNPYTAGHGIRSWKTSKILASIFVVIAALSLAIIGVRNHYAPCTNAAKALNITEPLKFSLTPPFIECTIPSDTQHDPA